MKSLKVLLGIVLAVCLALVATPQAEAGGFGFGGGFQQSFNPCGGFQPQPFINIDGFNRFGRQEFRVRLQDRDFDGDLDPRLFRFRSKFHGGFRSQGFRTPIRSYLFGRF